MSSTLDAVPRSVPRVCSADDIARLAGVTKQAVSLWRNRHKDFPKPITKGRMKMYHRQSVLNYLRRHGYSV